MADFFDSVSSDEENKTPPRAPPDSDSSDSEDDSNPAPKIKKKRSTRTFANEGPLGDDPLPPMTQTLFGGGGLFSSNLYSSSAISRKLPSDVPEDDDGDIEDIFRKKFTRKKTQNKHGKESKQKAQSSQQMERKGTRSTARPKGRPCFLSESDDDSAIIIESPKKDELPDEDRFAEYEPQVVFGEDESTDIESDSESKDASSFLSSSQMKEPTPPPSPVVDLSNPVNSPKKKGRKKALKKAISQLEHVQQIHNMMADNEEDVSITEVFTPSKESERDLVVKIQSRSGIQRFNMSRNDTFASVYEEMANHEFVSENRLAMFVGDKKVNVYDTPIRLGLEVADIIQCYIRKPEELDTDDVQDSNIYNADSLKLLVQGKDLKSRLTLSILKTEPMEKIMREYCKKTNVSFGSVSFQFDGEEIQPQDTPVDLDLEDDYCIDVVGL